MEEVRNTIQSMFANNKACWDMIDEMGGDTSMPHNLQNMAEAILSIPTGPLPPGVPTSLEELKKMVNRGQEIVVGTEIPDTYNSQNNPLIVAQNLNSSNNSTYGNAEGVILVRKYVEPVSQVFNGIAQFTYAGSTIYNFLNSTYLDNCSDELKTALTSITVPALPTNASGKWFLMSDTEVCLLGFDGIVEGAIWDYWKEKTGLSNAVNNNANNGRIMLDRNGVARSIWLRSRGANTASTYLACTVDTNGSAAAVNYYNTNHGVLPACFIGKDTPSQASTLEAKSPLVITPEYIPSVEKVKVEIKPKDETTEREDV